MGKVRRLAGKRSNPTANRSVRKQKPRPNDLPPQQKEVSRDDPNIASSKRPATRLVGRLLAGRLQPANYRMPDETRNTLAVLVEEMKPAASQEAFLSSLEVLIGDYQVFRDQDRKTSHSERNATNRLKEAHKKAKELRRAYEQARSIPAGALRLAQAWPHAQEVLQPTHYAGIPIRYPGQPPPSLSDVARQLNAFEVLFAHASSLPITRNDRGGRPRRSSEKDFIARLHRLAKEKLGAPLPSIREGAFKRLVGIALREVGWHHADLRPLLDPIEKPRSRKKPQSRK